MNDVHFCEECQHSSSICEDAGCRCMFGMPGDSWPDEDPNDGPYEGPDEAQEWHDFDPDA